MIYWLELCEWKWSYLCVSICFADGINKCLLTEKTKSKFESKSTNGIKTEKRFLLSAGVWINMNMQCEGVFDESQTSENSKIGHHWPMRSAKLFRFWWNQLNSVLQVYVGENLAPCFFFLVLRYDKHSELFLSLLFIKKR